MGHKMRLFLQDVLSNSHALLNPNLSTLSRCLFNVICLLADDGVKGKSFFAYFINHVNITI